MVEIAELDVSFNRFYEIFLSLYKRRKNSILKLTCVVVVSSVVSACGLSRFADPKTNPVIEDYVNVDRGIIATFATTAERRMVLVNTIEGDDYGKFCAEPPADVAESIAASLQAAITAAATTPAGQSAEAGAEFGRNIATAIQMLGQRSQGLTLYRDASFQLCALLLNKFINQDIFVSLYREIRNSSIELIRLELEKNNGQIGAGQLASLEAPTLNKLNTFLDDYFANRGSIVANQGTGDGGAGAAGGSSSNDGADSAEPTDG